MTQKSAGTQAEEATGKIEDLDRFVHQTYNKQIDWYWRTSSYNKNNYKRYRFLTVLLGALVTLIASLSTADLIANSTFWGDFFTILTPVLAATLTIINSLSQNFQWGATWRDMVINATRLQKERNRFLATNAEKRDHKKELALINEIVLEETQSFFKRILDSEAVPTDTPDVTENQEENKPSVAG